MKNCNTLTIYCEYNIGNNLASGGFGFATKGESPCGEGAGGITA